MTGCGSNTGACGIIGAISNGCSTGGVKPKILGVVTCRYRLVEHQAKKELLYLLIYLLTLFLRYLVKEKSRSGSNRFKPISVKRQNFLCIKGKVGIGVPTGAKGMVGIDGATGSPIVGATGITGASPADIKSN